MKIAAISDLHITNSNSKYDKDVNGVSGLVKRQQKCVKDFVEMCIEQDVDIILFCGDITDDEYLSPVEQSVLASVCSEFERFAELHGEVFFLSGNHTVSDSENKYSVISALDKYLNCTNCITSYTVVTTHGTTHHERCYSEMGEQPLAGFGEKFEIAFFPYINNYDKIEEQISEYEPDRDISIGVGHWPIVGAKLDNGTPAKSGVNLDKLDMDKFDLFICGDFHKPQEVQNDVYYVGAPFDLKFGDYTEWRGGRVFNIDIDTGDYSVENRINKHNISFWTGTFEEFETQFSDRTVDRSRVYAKIKGEITEQDLEKIESVEDDFWKLSKPLVSDIEDDSDEESVEIMNEEEDYEQTIRYKLEDEVEDEDLVERGVNLFKEEIK